MRESTITLPVSGRTVQLRRPPISAVSVVTAYQTRHPKPRPPMQKVTLMGKEEWVENIAHPDYAEALRAWNNDRMTALAEMYLRMGVASEPTEADLKVVGELRGALGGLTEGLSDHEVFIKFVLIQDDEDFEALSGAITELMQPTEAQITQHTDRFRRPA